MLFYERFDDEVVVCLSRRAGSFAPAGEASVHARALTHASCRWGNIVSLSLVPLGLKNLCLNFHFFCNVEPELEVRLGRIVGAARNFMVFACPLGVYCLCQPR